MLKVKQSGGKKGKKRVKRTLLNTGESNNERKRRAQKWLSLS